MGRPRIGDEVQALAKEIVFAIERIQHLKQVRTEAMNAGDLEKMSLLNDQIALQEQAVRSMLNTVQIEFWELD